MKITDDQLRRINDNRNTSLVTAARANDAAADAHGLQRTLADLGLDLDLVKYVFEQRALHIGAPLNPVTFAFFLDALAIGWTGRGFDFAANSATCQDKVDAARAVFNKHYITKPITHDDYDAWTR